MKATNRFIARAASVACSVLAVAAIGCRTQVIEHTRTVYVPAPAPAPSPPPQVVVAPAPAPEPVVMIESVNDFDAPLAVYGRWEVVGGYGRIWIPARVAPGWRPYSNGHWQRTDAGWYWVSDEPWGWATYHYGRWVLDARFGWVWVPRTEWAPAWVSWREGGGYVGWAPLPPAANMDVSVEVFAPAVVPRAYVFVEERRMTEPVRPTTVVVNNTTIINKTVNITKVKVVNKTVINEGPRPEVIERETGHKVQSVPANEFRHRDEQAVAARERNIPTRDKRVERTNPDRNRQPDMKTAAPPTVARPEAKPAQAVKPKTPPIPTSPQSAERDQQKPARDEKKNEAASKKEIPATPGKIGPEVKHEKAVEPRQEARPVEKPVVATKPAPAPQPAHAKPAAVESKHEAARDKKSAPKPVVFEPKSKIEVKSTPKRQSKTSEKRDKHSTTNSVPEPQR